MKTILVYGDSQVWGRVPKAEPIAERHAFWDRWPMQLERSLGSERVRVMANGINGRRTVFDDPFRPRKNGADYLEMLLDAHMPLDLVIIWLGTNDLQWIHHAGPVESAMGVGRLLDLVQKWTGDPPVAPPPVLVCCPPVIEAPAGWLVEKFRDGPEKSAGMAEAFRSLCAQRDVAFFDGANVAALSPIDGIHLTIEDNQKIADAMAPVVGKMIGL